MSTHLDLDALADVLAGEAEPAVTAHAADCETCAAALVDLEAALVPVAAVLAALPDPAIPDDLVARLDAALAKERQAGRRVVPITSARSRSWLPWAGGAAAAAVLVVGTVLVVHPGGNNSSTSSATTSLAKAQDGALVRNETGNDYRRDGKALAAAVPRLLAGGAATSGGIGPSTTTKQPLRATAATPREASGGLASLHTAPGLASCLSSLTTPDVPGVPLAVDYASYEGQPALVVLMPSARAGKIDAFVLGAGCSAADAKVLLFRRVARP